MNFRWILCLGVLGVCMGAFSQQKVLPQLGKDPVKDIIAAMTLDEKLDIIRGTGMKFTTPNAQGTVAGNIGGKVPGAAGSSHAISRLGIPAIILADGPAGLRIDSARFEDPDCYYATAFPIATALASTWNTELVNQVGKAMGNEVLEYGVDVLLAPGMNMHRNPLGGRNFEYYSEDPLISGKMAAAMVNGIQSNGVGTSIKHFAVNDQESNRNGVDAIVSERALREIYLKPFEIAVKEADPWTVMSSYNKINGTYASENYDLLTTILRKEWGFNGLVMTDWFAGRDFAAQVKAGNDLLMPGRKREVRSVSKALKEKTLAEVELDRNVEKILNVILRTPAFRDYKYSNAPDLNAHVSIARQAGSEGMILLKNEDRTLPVKSTNIALLGNASYDLFVGGTGSGEVYKAYTISLFQGLEDAGYVLDKDLENKYKGYVAKENAARPERQSVLDVVKPVDEMHLENSDLNQLAEKNDIALITIGRNAGENSDRCVETDYYFNEHELKLIENTSKAFHKKGKKVVVVLNIDAVVDVTKWRNCVDGILISWQPGQEAGHAIADVISGKVNPSGHLTTTFPLNYQDVPSAKYFPGTPAETPEKTIYNEGVYVGYRYYNTFKKQVAYEFGYGLSYTNFDVRKVKVNSGTFDNEITVNLKVKNSGKVAGKEVVQLYLAAPGKTMDKPESELKKFVKTKLLQPGESQNISFTLKSSDLASFDEEQSAWIAESGIYTIKIGASSKNILMTKTFTLKEEVNVEKVNKVLVPNEVIEKFKQ
ncbi:glycoside hydrolase family 3 N-terminal domain-containing protein [Plebeiibacterium marinum]|uniref:Glycoside hydrolase family 3 C-terminal domain-containing protein n=1 Tax=Plebeiibacterium marinum TaxID=2992111 RepID=A0AAE3SLI9_9BACT|nr:glycoside hydrolase family 3 N-terminal domain-containing protein [Plebeiobacterium marinum]MCW3807742.1 glycoside hydrolase family 3 C-terminal domain-containing protein [Plebeiobacterium marinum]